VAYSASLEPLAPNVYLLRVHPDWGGLGDYWDWGCVLVVKGGVATVKLAQSAPTPAQARAAREAGAAIGVTKYRFERVAGKRGGERDL
jgi:hypothetical protein